MTRIDLFAAVFGTACLVASAGAQAQGYGVPRNAYGGGFIELLMTGRDPGPAVSRAPSAAPVARAEPRRNRLVADPFAEDGVAGWPAEQEPRRLAALPDPAELPVAREMPAEYRRTVVAYDGREAAGTIVIHTPTRFLYLVQPGGQAIRYGIGVGRPGFAWAGMKTITRKAEWPSWTPPAEMIKRRPDLPRFMEGGPANPLGARALYLGTSLYRIHGTNEPWTIGQNVSSGCIRMMNDDVVDLYGRVGVGTRVKVI
ncbi:MAG: L,D-transpeptidase [Methylobacteriaceae bacterium]|nr:L,D-transpeptidase [Methylobacteriaceae bacterium]